MATRFNPLAPKAGEIITFGDFGAWEIGHRFDSRTSSNGREYILREEIVAADHSGAAAPELPFIMTARVLHVQEVQ